MTATLSDSGSDTGLDAGPAPPLARPQAAPRRMSLWTYLRLLRDSSVATYSDEAFEAEIIQRKLFWQRAVILNRPAAIQHVLLDNAANYVKSEIARSLLEPALGKGLLTSEGETWRRQRRIMSPAFDPRSVAAYASAIVEITESLAERWSSLPPGAVIDVAAEMMRLTLLIVARTMFSTDAQDIVPIVEHAVERYQVEVRPSLFDLVNLPEWLPRPSKFRRRRIFTELDAVIDRLMRRDANSAATPKDLLARLMSARDAETGLGMSAQEVRDQVVTIFMAGHETTAQALTWTWYLLSLHPAIERKFHAEIDAVLDRHAPRFEDMAKLPYARMVLDESLRLYPPAHTISRQALADDVVTGLPVPRGATVLIVPWLVHRHRTLWDRPEVFDPERFTPENAAARPRFAYLPFGGGPRICIGAGFAMTEALIVLASVGRRFRLRLVPDQAVEPVGLITLRPRNGLKMIVERRC